MLNIWDIEISYDFHPFRASHFPPATSHFPAATGLLSAQGWWLVGLIALSHLSDANSPFLGEPYSGSPGLSVPLHPQPYLRSGVPLEHLSSSFSSVQSLSCVRLFATHELQHARPLCPSPTPGVHSNSRPSSQWCHPAISSCVVPFSSCLHKFIFNWWDCCLFHCIRHECLPLYIQSLHTTGASQIVFAVNCANC